MAKKKKGKSTGQSFDLSGKLKNIQTLVLTKRPKEAIAYQYMLFTMICGMKYREAKHPSQSIRDFAMTMVRNHSLNPANVYPFVQEVEHIIYGGRQPDNEAYQRSLERFGEVFREITGKKLPKL
ncbi:hypothetical protein DSAG12_02041 [Promethearchaeum syntrophicum]|uniref:DUF4129 domain-containing protein n=1 Tax=Promethearchaeum syntrophicum TaxID=2594042 RepID=A0A5B9DB43_9ARCH|nr:hypothetical protein [Candidatus Prometheoarchaeum syntrophicum]QEE16211.1 hypothetical protein DSAG12_02041 [Candidatus Prometheoarchaeum syntrophicum]